MPSGARDGRANDRASDALDIGLTQKHLRLTRSESLCHERPLGVKRRSGFKRIGKPDRCHALLIGLLVPSLQRRHIPPEVKRMRTLLAVIAAFTATVTLAETRTVFVGDFFFQDELSL